MKTKTTFYLLSAAAIIGALLFAIGHRGDTSNGAMNPETISVRLKWIYDPGFAGEMIALKAGLFNENGISVEIRPGGFETDPIRTVASGVDQIGITGADTFLLARAKGIPIVAFAAGYLQTPVVFYSKQSSEITVPRDFIGKKVGYQAGQDTATVYAALLSATNVSRDQVVEVPVKYDFSPFLTGAVDVWPGYAASQSYILNREHIAYNAIKPADYQISYLGTVYFTTEDYLSKHGDEIQAFVNAVLDGWEYTYNNSDEAIPLLESFDPKALTPEMVSFTLKHQKDSIIPKGRRFGEFSINDWIATQSILLEQGLLDKKVTLDRAVTFRFINKYYSAQ